MLTLHRGGVWSGPPAAAEGSRLWLARGHGAAGCGDRDSESRSHAGFGAQSPGCQHCPLVRPPVTVHLAAGSAERVPSSLSREAQGCCMSQGEGAGETPGAPLGRPTSPLPGWHVGALPQGDPASSWLRSSVWPWPSAPAGHRPPQPPAASRHPAPHDPWLWPQDGPLPARPSQPPWSTAQGTPSHAACLNPSASVPVPVWDALALNKSLSCRAQLHWELVL